MFLNGIMLVRMYFAGVKPSKLQIIRLVIIILFLTFHKQTVAEL